MKPFQAVGTRRSGIRTWPAIPIVLCIVVALHSSPVFGQDGSGRIQGITDVWQADHPPKTLSPTETREFLLGELLNIQICNLDGWIIDQLKHNRLDPAAYDVATSESNAVLEVKNLKDNGTLSEDAIGLVQGITWKILNRLYPVIDGISFPKAQRLAWEWVPVPKGSQDTIYQCRFLLEHDSTDLDVWQKWQDKCLSGRMPILTMAYIEKEGEMPRQLPTLINTGTGTMSKPFEVRLYSQTLFWLCLATISIVMTLLSILALQSDMLRDTNQPLNPDGRYPWSLSKAQMAFWFVMVTGSFLFLWMVTSRLDVLNEQALWLIGIGSGTALGTAALANSQRDEPAIRQAAIKFGVRATMRWKALKAEVLQKIKDLDGKLSNPALDDAGRAAIESELADWRKQEIFFRRSWVGCILNDWLTEDGVVSFHRFQMLAWTLALGLVFAVRVLSDLRMPEFDVTVLALMGISAGTYLGFKLPMTKPGTVQSA
jgi:hypothetical protein